MESSSRSLSTCLFFSFPSPFLVKRPRNFAVIFWIPKAFLHSLEQNPVLGFQFHFPCCLIQAFSHCSKVKKYLCSCLEFKVCSTGCKCKWQLSSSFRERLNVHLRAKGKGLTVVPCLKAWLHPSTIVYPLAKANCLDLSSVWTYRFLMRIIQWGRSTQWSQGRAAFCQGKTQRILCKLVLICLNCWIILKWDMCRRDRKVSKEVIRNT